MRIKVGRVQVQNAHEVFEATKFQVVAGRPRLLRAALSRSPPHEFSLECRISTIWIAPGHLLAGEFQIHAATSAKGEFLQ